MTTDEVRDLIDSKRVVVVGREEKNIVHLLFYSEVDRRYFVVIKDGNNQEVITILKLVYYRDRRPTRKELNKAKELARKKG
ncbi:MAG: hypothetical protein WCW87_00420 [Candidatus Paceibacterota bacterium]